MKKNRFGGERLEVRGERIVLARLICLIVISLTSYLLPLTSTAQIVDAFQGILPVTDTAMKRSLNGVWRLKVVDGIDNREAAVPDEDETWGTIPVPGCWEAYGFCKPSYDKALPLTGYYRTAFTVPEAWRGMRIVLRFDGVLYGYDLWVNGKKAGLWRSGYNTALFDITDCLSPLTSHHSPLQQLAMRVISQFPGSDFDYNDDWAPNGIFRDVTLMAVPKTHLSDLTIRTKNTGEVTVETKIANPTKGTEVRHEILDAQGKTIATGNQPSTLHLQPSTLHLWTAETPYLYTLRTRLLQKGKPLQTFEHKFGIRELTIDGNVLKLNGQAIKLRGVTCHSTDPRTVKVVTDDLTLHDMKLMKEASVNYIRTSHYPREPRFYELADSLGFYIINEVPFGYGDKNLSKEEFYPVLQQRAQATIRRDKNHPSVLIWSLGNENPLTDICIRLGDYVKTQLDPSRPYCYPQVGSYFRRFFEGKDTKGFPSPAPIYTPHYPTTGQIAGFYQHCDRPVIFTEYCHTLGISFEDHDRQWEIIQRTPGIAGGSVWEWVDQGMPFGKEKGKVNSEKFATALPTSAGNPISAEGDSTSAAANSSFFILHSSFKYGYEEKVYTSENAGFEMCGNKGTDGLLYADRTPLPNYYELQHNYARAFVADSILTTADGTLRLTIANRYDFLNLKDNVTFSWAYSEDRDTIASGVFSPDCAPHTSVPYTLALPTSPNPSRLCLLHLTITDAQGNTFLRQSIPINPAALTPRLLAGLTAKTGDPLALVQDGILVRAGRKATLGEMVKIADKRLERYLLPLSADGTKAGPIATDIKAEPSGNATHYTFSLTPDTTDTILTELGIAFLLDKRIDRVQWIGNGPLPTYPGRYRAGRYGFWAMQQCDLYFEGNRRGVDAALLTDKDGSGLLLFCQNGNVSFEQTDRGIVLTYNAAVSGQGPKFRQTAFPVIAKEIGTVSSDFYLYRVDTNSIPQLIHDLFDHPRTIPAPFKPFVTQYDTYLMRYNEVKNEE